MLRSPGLGQHSTGGWEPRTFGNPDLMTEPSWAATPPPLPETLQPARVTGGPLTPAFPWGGSKYPSWGGEQ